MSDRLAVFNHGRVEQVGTPGDVYENPRNEFVAGFVGVSNVVSGDLAFQLRGDAEAFTVRPEKISLADPGHMAETGKCSIDGVVKDATYLGAFTRHRVDIGGLEMLVISQNVDSRRGDTARLVGRSVRLVWDKDSCRPLAGAEEPTPAIAGVSE